MSYEYCVHGTLVKREMCIKQRFIHCIQIFDRLFHLSCVVEDLIPTLHGHRHIFAPTLWNDSYILQKFTISSRKLTMQIQLINNHQFEEMSSHIF